MASSKKSKTTPRMVREPEVQDARIEIRVDRSLKRLIETAAALRGQSLSAFMVAKSVADAQHVIDEYARTRVSLADWERFQQILADPRAPNAALKKAARCYTESVAHSDGL